MGAHQLAMLWLLTAGALTSMAADTGKTTEEAPDFESEIEDLMSELDIGGGPSGAEEMTYDGSLEDRAPDYVPGKPVSITLPERSEISPSTSPATIAPRASGQGLGMWINT